jgi:hypothetical protein
MVSRKLLTAVRIIAYAVQIRRFVMEFEANCSDKSSMRFREIKNFVKHRAPYLVPAYSYICWNFFIRPRWQRMGVAAVFTEHYRNNGWGSSESVSGTGSTVGQTAVVREILLQIVRTYEIGTVLDIPCGDFNWMRLVDLPVRYIGADIVDDLVAENNRKFANPGCSFIKLDLTEDPLPQADLIMCRDCLFHFSFEHIAKALTNIKGSGARFVLATTNSRLDRNRNIVTGGWRRLNLRKPPFSLPEPLMLIDEKIPDQDKSLGLWRISDL